MAILSGATIRRLNILEPCLDPGKAHGLSFGLGPSGYDLRLDLPPGQKYTMARRGQFKLAASMERFTMPNNVVGVVHDKSTLARQGLSVFNTIIEPGWNGFLTLELINHGREDIRLFAGQGIAQVVFHFTDQPTEGYKGKYQNQPAGPVEARFD